MPKHPTTTQHTLQQRIALCMRQLCRGGAITPQTEQLYHTLLRTEFELKLLWLEEKESCGLRVESPKLEAGSPDDP